MQQNITANFQLDENRLGRIGGELTLVEATVVHPYALDAQRPVAQVATKFAREALIAAVRRLADRQQLVISPSDPGHL